MGVPHHQHTDRRIAHEFSLGPRRLPRNRVVNQLGMRRDVAGIVAEAPSDPKAHAGWDEAKCRDGGGHVENSIEQRGDAVFLVNTVTMDREYRTAADGEPQLAGMKGHAGFGTPEGVAPAIVIAAYHEDRHPARQLHNAGGHPDAVARNQATIGEPEVVNVSGQQQRITERGDGVEEREERRLIGGGSTQVGVSNNDETMSDHRRERWTMQEPEATDSDRITTIRRRVDYSETDQQGVVYHARYLVWLDVARTEHLRVTGMSYREMEASGFQLMVSELSIRYRKSARYDDPIRVRTWVRAIDSRRVTFGYAVEHDETGLLLATATTDLFVLDPKQRLARFPAHIAARLLATPDPVRL